MSMNSFHARKQRSAPATRAPQAPVDHGGLLRADALLVERGLATSRARAQEAISAGRVIADGTTLRKASHLLLPTAELQVAPDEAERFVSRGGLKLAGALAHTAVDANGRICLDVGQSTGGFTDCLLQAGAARVVGVEVGHGQLAAKLAQDARCITLEGLNARELDAAQLGAHYPIAGFDLIVCDASFISLTLLMPRWPALLAPHGEILTLVKPQFEVGPKGLGKGGIVRDAALYAEVETRLRQAAAECRLAVRDWFDSPITGGDGNREFFLWMQHAQH
ncbi:MAG: TlyA family RNA methyltransferase [Pseudazoarcus pumilus]|nr:TlyA family RNA methyltransferase [Pseudazoarcus pumilus]